MRNLGIVFELHVPNKISITWNIFSFFQQLVRLVAQNEFMRYVHIVYYGMFYFAYKMFFWL